MNAKRRALGSLPIIDLTPFTTHGSEAARRRTAEDLRRACIDIGFFYLSGHGLSRDRLQRVLDIGMRFFALPLEEKMKLHQSKSAGRHGYVGTGGIRENEDDSSDVRERFRMTREPIPGEPAMGQEAWADPVWPSPALAPGFETGMRDYLRTMVTLSQQLARAFAMSLELPEAFFDEMFRYPDGVLFFNYYPPLTPAEVERRRWSFSPHADYGAFTLLLQDDVGGLQARNAAGDWIDVPPIEGTLVVNIGDLFAMWTNDLYVSTLHQASNVSGRARLSVPFFAGPHELTRIDCLPSCQSAEHPPRHPSVLAGEYVRSLIAHQNRTGRPGVSENTAGRFQAA